MACHLSKSQPPPRSLLFLLLSLSLSLSLSSLPGHLCCRSRAYINQPKSNKIFHKKWVFPSDSSPNLLLVPLCSPSCFLPSASVQQVLLSQNLECCDCFLFFRIWKKNLFLYDESASWRLIDWCMQKSLRALANLFQIKILGKWVCLNCPSFSDFFC